MNKETRKWEKALYDYERTEQLEEGDRVSVTLNDYGNVVCQVVGAPRPDGYSTVRLLHDLIMPYLGLREGSSLLIRPGHIRQLTRANLGGFAE